MDVENKEIRIRRLIFIFMKLLTEEDKKNLRTFSRYLKSFGKDYAMVEFNADYDEVDLSKEIPFSNSYFSHPYDVPIPEFILPIINKILEFCEGKTSIDVENPNYFNFEIEINAHSKEVSAIKRWGYTSQGDSEGLSWTSEELHEDDNVFSSLEEAGLSGELQLDYNGGGDSGYVESSFTNGESVPADIDDFCYGVLETNYGGWEINEGSQGYFIFDTKNKTIYLEHSMNVDSESEDTIFEESFEKTI